MSSASSPVRQALEGYIAGRVKAERVVEAVAAAYYNGEQGGGSRERLRLVMDVVERAHPGVVELTTTAEKPGFAVRVANRPFPKEYEPALRAAVEAVLVGAQVGAQHAAPLHGRAPAPPSGGPPTPSLVARLVGAIRRLFTAST